MKPLDEVARSIRSRVSVTGRPVPRATLADRMDELHVPAVSVAVLERSGEVVGRAWGSTPDTLFQAASISKPTTAMGTVRLAADGVFGLDQNVNELLQTWKLPDGDGVTPRRILSHSAGLSVHGFDGYEPGTDIPSLVQILDGVPPANSEAVRVVRPPGEAYQYSGGGTTLLQLLLEDVTGEPFAELTRRVVLDPLEMRASTYEQPLRSERHASAARGHDLAGTPISGGWRVHPEQAAAGLWTNPSELVRVAGEVVRPGRVLDERLRDEMLTPQVDGFGVGWSLDGDWFQHGGSNAGYHCLLYGSARHGRAAAVMTNGDGAGTTLCAEIVATIAEVFEWPGFLHQRDVIQLDDAALEAIAGDYELSPDAVVSIRRDGDTLMSSAPGIAERELFAASPTDFFRLDVPAEIRVDGGTLTLMFGAIVMTAPKRG